MGGGLLSLGNSRKNNMFGLTRREQRWRAEQKAAETLANLAVGLTRENRAAEIEELNKKVVELTRDLEIARKDASGYRDDVANLTRISLETINNLEKQLRTAEIDGKIEGVMFAVDFLENKADGYGPKPSWTEVPRTLDAAAAELRSEANKIV